MSDKQKMTLVSNSPIELVSNVLVQSQLLIINEQGSDYKDGINLDDSSHFPLTCNIDGEDVEVASLGALAALMSETFFVPGAGEFVWNPSLNVFQRSLESTGRVANITIEVVTARNKDTMVGDYIEVVDDDGDQVIFYDGTFGPGFVHPIFVYDNITFNQTTMSFWWYLEGMYPGGSGANTWQFSYGRNLNFAQGKKAVWMRRCELRYKENTPEKITVKWLNKQEVLDSIKS